MNKRSFGNRGEDLAVLFLQRRGYRILKRNYSSRYGEIDIVARHKGGLCFVEVKTRSDGRCGSPLEAVGWRKQRQLGRMALEYLASHPLKEKFIRFDIVSVLLEDGRPVFELVENAFEWDGDDG